VDRHDGVFKRSFSGRDGNHLVEDELALSSKIRLYSDKPKKAYISNQLVRKVGQIFHRQIRIEATEIVNFGQHGDNASVQIPTKRFRKT
jgi:hypothetical protein